MDMTFCTFLALPPTKYLNKPVTIVALKHAFIFLPGTAKEMFLFTVIERENDRMYIQVFQIVYNFDFNSSL